MEFNNGIKFQEHTPQMIYDAFNDFIFSADTKILTKLIARSLLFKETIDVPGDIVECGVFKGSGILSWLKLKRILAPNSFKKVIGFDFFDNQDLVSTLSGDDQIKMNDLFKDRNYNHSKDFDQILKDTIHQAGFRDNEFELVKGDVCVTTKAFADERPGLRISILYLDLDIAIPTFETLKALWDRVTPGGLVVFDEYAYHQWSEAEGADRFFAEKDIEIKSLNFPCPTAYVKKENRHHIRKTSYSPYLGVKSDSKNFGDHPTF